MASKKRKPRKLTTPTFEPWASVLFTDLHVSAKTIDRCLDVLQATRELAKERGLQDVICLGDFWDARGVLSVRQIHLVMAELDRYAEDEIYLTIVPGNHDQVTSDGLINGVRPFEPYDTVTVAHDVILEPDYGCAYVPWREEEGAQVEIFKQVPDGYTVFAHAEIQGATTNNKHVAPGRVSLDDLSRFRAVYAGHYHKRQKLGEHSWYIGSPFEMNFGEREWPHGIALASSDSIEPEFVELPEFPKHFVFSYPDDRDRFEEPREIDKVIIHTPAKEMESPDFLSAMEVLKAINVQPLPVAEDEDDKPPAVAMRIDQAVEEYVREYAGGDEDLIALGKNILSKVPDTESVIPLGAVVRPLSIKIEDFLALRGSHEVALDDRGTVLLHGTMGVGKTSISDALTWCLYDKTSPRKAGTSGGQLRADHVIHDSTDGCKVTTTIQVDDDEYAVTRTKKRGKGSRVKLTKNGKKMKVGVADAQDQINSIVGLDYDLWRTCVSLGQGSVANFVTDADKARKELLSRAFQLGSCTHAVKWVKGALRDKQDALSPLDHDLITKRARLDAMIKTDFSAEASRWDEKQIAEADEIRKSITNYQIEVNKYDQHLATEPEWLDIKKRCEEYIEKEGERLTKAAAPAQAGKLHQKMGALQAEMASLDMREKSLKERHQHLLSTVGATTGGTCDTCGQRVDVSTFESMVSDVEEQLSTIVGTRKDLKAQFATAQAELGSVVRGGTPESNAIKTGLQDAKDKLVKCNQALNAIAQVKGNRGIVAQRWTDGLARLEALEREENPFRKRMEEHKGEVESITEQMHDLEEKIGKLKKEITALQFWEAGFSAKGLPVLVLRLALYEIEQQANKFLGALSSGTIYVKLTMETDSLGIEYFEMSRTEGPKERTYSQLSGGQRRCVELSFVPFALSEVIFGRTGVRVPFLFIDELTTHLPEDVKPEVCKVLHSLGRESVFVIDHDVSVQSEFDQIVHLTKDAKGNVTMEKR